MKILAHTYFSKTSQIPSNRWGFVVVRKKGLDVFFCSKSKEKKAENLEIRPQNHTFAPKNTRLCARQQRYHDILDA